MNKICLKKIFLLMKFKQINFFFKIEKKLKICFKKIQYFLLIFGVSIAEDSGKVPSTSASTSESYCVQVSM